MKFSQIKKDVNQMVRKNFGKLFGSLLLILLISICVSSISTLFRMGDSVITSILGVILSIVSYYISLALSVGFLRMCMDIYNEKDAQIGDLFTFFKKPKDMLVLFAYGLIVVFIIIIIAAALFFIMFGSDFVNLVNTYSMSGANAGAALASVIVGMIGKFILFYILIMIVGICVSALLQAAELIIAKENQFLIKGIVGNSFKLAKRCFGTYILVSVIVSLLTFAVSFICMLFAVLGVTLSSSSGGFIGVLIAVLSILVMIGALLYLSIYLSIYVAGLFDYEAEKMLCDNPAYGSFNENGTQMYTQNEYTQNEEEQIINNEVTSEEDSETLANNETTNEEEHKADEDNNLE